MNLIKWLLIILSLGACCKAKIQDDYPGPFRFHNIAVKLNGADSLNVKDLDTLIRKTKTIRQDSVSLVWKQGYQYDTFAMASGSDSFIWLNNGRFSASKQRLVISLQWQGNNDTVLLYNSRFRWAFISRAWQFSTTGTDCNPKKSLVKSNININGVDCDMLQDMQSSQGFDIQNEQIVLKK